MTALRRLLPIVGPSAGVAALAVGLFLIAPYALLVMAPALALGWLVALGLFSGDQAIAWVRRVARRLRRRTRPQAARLPQWTERPVPRGGRLLAAALASRPPPVAA